MNVAALRPARFVRLLAADAMNVSRDPMLIAAIVMSIIPPIVMFVWGPAIDASALAAFGVADMSRYVAMVVLVLPAVLIGWVTGFLLLEDRDDGVLVAVDVTPIGKAGFVLYRVTVTALLTAAITAGAVWLMVPWLSLAAMGLVILAVAAEAVIAAVLLVALARNKVEGLALTKLTNIAAIVPLAALVPSAWRIVAGVVPTYWIGELLAPQPLGLPFWLITLAVLATHAASLALVFRLFQRRVG